jgi:hypothetical protein
LAYNQMILKTLRTLPEERYLVVSYQSMQSECAKVFSFLSSRWAFRLQYKQFASVYRKELISRKADVAPAAVSPELLDQAQQLDASLQSYLQRSRQRLAALATLR